MKKTYLTMIVAMTVVATMLTACGKPATVETTEDTEVTVVETTETIDNSKNAEETVETDVEETTETTEETTEETTAPEHTDPTVDRPIESTVANQNPDATFGSIDNISYVCSLQATCETDFNACRVDVNSDNPYDVVYDYGTDYQAYVDACDWDLVFDADYYKTTFPMLALQYHNDDALLLKHFQTVGIHEGRQGSSNFNVQAYAYNCSDEVYNAFGRNWAAYYIYYMMNATAESSVNTVSANNGKPVYQQMSCVYTALQSTEYNSVCEYRTAAGVCEAQLNSELCAFANYRAYINAHDGYDAHDWAINNDPAISDALNQMGSTNGKYAENTVTQRAVMDIANYAMQYAMSPEHYALMTSSDYNFVGCSNFYWNDSTSTGSHFDVYAKDLNTVI